MEKLLKSVRRKHPYSWTSALNYPKLSSGADLIPELGGSLNVQHQSLNRTSNNMTNSTTNISGEATDTPQNSSLHPSLQFSSLPGMYSTSNGTDGHIRDDDDFEHLALAESIKRLEVDFARDRFIGKSSGLMLVQNAIDLKNELTGNQGPPNFLGTSTKRVEFWTVRPVS